MAASASVDVIPLRDQHAFLQYAKDFQWAAVKERLAANPGLVNIQPCGRDGTKRWSALHQAAYGGSADAVRFLLRSNADPICTTNDGKTPLEVANSQAIRNILRTFCSCTHSTPSPRTPPSTSGTAKRHGTGHVTAVYKAMKKRKSKIAKGKRGKTLVYKGSFVKTTGGLTKDKLIKNKKGKVVSKRMQARGTSAYVNVKKWIEAFMRARATLNISGFVPVKKGSGLYAKTMEFYWS